MVDMASRGGVRYNAKVGEKGERVLWTRKTEQGGREGTAERSAGKVTGGGGGVSAKQNAHRQSDTLTHKLSRYCRLFCFQFY